MEEVYYQTREQHEIWSAFQADRISPLSTEELDHYSNKTILITGAGGFIGSSLAKELATLPLAHLVLLDQAEQGLHRLSENFRTENISTKATFLVGSILDGALLGEIFSEHRPDIVFHAAAHKHVPLMQQNPFAATETNVLGTSKLAEAAIKFNTERFILLSTDKAVDPISVMGASKRIAEQIVLAARGNSMNVFTVARLCNVLGSTGSVGPLFVNAIAAGIPLSLTDSNVTRYFITIADAVRFLQRVAVSDVSAGVTVPTSGSPRRISELAEFLLERSGSKFSKKTIVEIGLRPGEKLHEQLISASEIVHTKGEMMTVDSAVNSTKLSAALEEICSAVKTRDTAQLESAFQRILPGYTMNHLSAMQEIIA